MTETHDFLDFSFAELLTPNGLMRLDQTFLAYLEDTSPKHFEALTLYRNGSANWSLSDQSEWLIELAIHLQAFIAKLFAIERELDASQVTTTELDPIAQFKKYFILKRAKKELNKIAARPSLAECETWLQAALQQLPLQSKDLECNVGLLAQDLLQDPAKNADGIEKLVAWCIHHLTLNTYPDWVSFKTPNRFDAMRLIPTVSRETVPNSLEIPSNEARFRDGFTLTDPRMSLKEVHNEIHYCIYCHDHDGDFCSKGFPTKKGDPTQGFKKNAVDLTLTGCPLDEKVSEMNRLKRDGHTIAALAMVMIDNPMCPATGHRICNDCMKACIYQKQDPVNIPQIETRVLTDTLALPFGVEIYDLLTRWHPLRQTQWVMKPYNSLKVLIGGMGPAGFTLAHHLLLEGFAVVGFDGLKIEKLPDELLTTPIRDYKSLEESLDERIMAGFGGVAEYGITVRYDKNFLKLIYISLSRKPTFQVFGSVRFGGTMTIEKAFELGFDHFVLAVGAGLPKALPVPNSMAPGMRQANDFLMALQLGNAAKFHSLSQLEVQLPAVVIGGGLTGVDTATEIQAYYISLVEKTLMRFEILSETRPKEEILAQFDEQSRGILCRYLEHGQLVKAERARAKALKQSPNLTALIHEFGGVTIVYRRSMVESPAYINNHEELHNALREGVYYIEHLEPKSVSLDEFGAVHSILFDDMRDPTITHELPARYIAVATGTQPNTAYEFEHKGTFNRVNLRYQHYEDVDGELQLAEDITHCKEPHFGPFTSYHVDQKRVSLIGDTHPVFHGNVVKAIASGTRTYPKILALYKNQLKQLGKTSEYKAFNERMNHLFNTHVVHKVALTPNIIQLDIKAPLAASMQRAGEFFKLQNYERHAKTLKNTLLQMEALALPAAWCDPDKGLLRFYVQTDSVSGKIASFLEAGEPVALMGPAGVRAKITEQSETIVLIIEASATSLAFTQNVASHARALGNHVVCIVHLKTVDDLFCQAQIHNSADNIFWISDNKEALSHVESGAVMHANDALAALLAMTEIDHPEILNRLNHADRLFIIGTPTLLKQFQQNQEDLITKIFWKSPSMIGSVYGNMQCMLKGVCAQCLQWQINPETGQRTKAVFACSWQDEPLELIDIEHLAARQENSIMLHAFNRMWLEHILQ